jgi:hypothetical protein
MAGAGVGTGQDHVFRGPTTAIDTHLLVSALQRSGISLAGAQQFSRGQAVTNHGDRLALAAVLSDLLKRSVRP